MRTSHPEEKHLVFSYYDDALKLIKGALQANRLPHVEFMGGVKVCTAIVSVIDNPGWIGRHPYLSSQRFMVTRILLCAP